MKDAKTSTSSKRSSSGTHMQQPGIEAIFTGVTEIAPDTKAVRASCVFTYTEIAPRAFLWSASKPTRRAGPWPLMHGRAGQATGNQTLTARPNRRRIKSRDLTTPKHNANVTPAPGGFYKTQLGGSVSRGVGGAGHACDAPGYTCYTSLNTGGFRKLRRFFGMSQC